MKKGLSIAFLFVLCALSFMSCDTVSDNYLLGKWQLIAVEEREYENGQLVSSYYEDTRLDPEYIEFLKNNKAVSTFLGENLTYVLNEKGDLITFTENNDVDIFKIVRLSAKQFELISGYELDEDLDKKEENLRFEKIK